MPTNQFDTTQAQDQPAPKHAGILRQEMLALRHVFGLGDVPSDIDLGSFLTDSDIKDVILFTVHIRGSSTPSLHDDIRPFRFGLSTLDTRALEIYRDATLGAVGSSSRCVSKGRQVMPVAQDLIKSYHLELPESESGTRFRFGQPTRLSCGQIKSLLETVLAGRRSILVTFGGSYGNDMTECSFIDQLQLDTPPLYHIDLLKAIQFPLQTHYRYSLKKLLDTLNLPWQDLDVAGNSARFTMHATAMTAVRDWNLRNRTKPPISTQITLICLTKIARSWTGSTDEVPSLERLFSGQLQEPPLTKKERRRIIKKERRDRKRREEELASTPEARLSRG